MGAKRSEYAGRRDEFRFEEKNSRLRWCNNLKTKQQRQGMPYGVCNMHWKTDYIVTVQLKVNQSIDAQAPAIVSRFQ